MLLRQQSIFFSVFESFLFKAVLKCPLTDWLVSCRIKDNCPLVGAGPVGGVPSVGGGGLCRGS